MVVSKHFGIFYSCLEGGVFIEIFNWKNCYLQLHCWHVLFKLHPMLTLDHIAVLGTDLSDATAHCQTALGLEMGAGGTHARFATHNRLIGLQDRVYLEAVAIDPDTPGPKDARWFGLDDFSGPPRLDKWICRVPDIKSALKALPEAGQPVHVTRGRLSWTMAVPFDGRLPWDGLFPALIEWHVEDLPGDMLPKADRYLETLTIAHPDAPGLAARLEPFLKDPRIRFVSAPTACLSAALSGGGMKWKL